MEHRRAKEKYDINGSTAPNSMDECDEVVETVDGDSDSDSDDSDSDDDGK